MTCEEVYLADVAAMVQYSASGERKPYHVERAEHLLPSENYRGDWSSCVPIPILLAGFDGGC